MDSAKVTEIYNLLKDKAFSVQYSTENLKIQEEKIQKDMAESKGLMDKDNKPDFKKIKSALLKKSIEKFLTQKDKLKEDHDTMEDYLSLIKTGKVKREEIQKFTTLENLKKDESSEFNALKKSKESEIDIGTFSAIILVIKEDIEKHKNNSVDSETDVKPKNNEEILNKIKEVRRIVKGG